MQDLEAHALTRVVGGQGWSKKVDKVVSKVYPKWTKLSCTSRGMWVGTTAGAAAGAGGSAINPVVGSLAGPFAGTLASTSYIEACQGSGNPVA